MAAQQQINLYQPRFRKQEKVFSASSMLMVLIAAIVVLVGVYGYAKWNVVSLANESERLQTLQVKEIARLDTLSKKYPVKKKSILIEQQFKDLQNEKKAKQYLVNTLSGRSIGNSKGFSSYFAGIARKNIKGMWIRRLELDNGGDVIGIYGSTQKPELVPQFLRALSEEESFSGSEFQLFNMNRDDENRSEIKFSLRTVVSDDEK